VSETTVRLKDRDIQLRAFAPGDAAAMLAFARSLPEHDLLFLSRDITHPKVVAAWLAQVADGQIHSVVAVEGDAIIGCTAVVRDELGWSPHVGEMRVLLAVAARGSGLGRVLAQAAFGTAISLGLEKLTAQMTIDQAGAIGLFEELGFRGEALLKDHVRGRDGRTYDIAVLSCDVARAASQRAALGLTDGAA
jgi:L-amino acid N-acyltransferase YncA